MNTRRDWVEAIHTVDFDPCIESQLDTRHYFQGLIWCNFGHVTPQNLWSTKLSNLTEWFARS